MEGEIGQIVFAVQIGGAKVDPEPARNRSVLATRAAIGARCARFLGNRDAAHFHIGIDQSVEGARHLPFDPLQTLIDEGEDFLASRIAFGKLVTRVLRQRLHPFAHRPLGVADFLEDRVHPAVQLRQLLQPQFMDFVRGHAGGGRCAGGPAVPFIALRLRPHARIALGKAALGAQFGELAFERGDDLARYDPVERRDGGLGGGQFAGLHRADIAFARGGDHRFHLRDRLVEQEVRRDEAHSTRLLDPFGFPVEHRADFIRAGDIEAYVIGIAQRLAGAEMAREIDVSADVLDHEVGGIAPASHGDIAIGQVHPRKRAGKGAFDDFETGLLIGGEAGLGIAAGLFQCPAQGCLIGIAPGFTHRAKGAAPFRILPGVHAQTRRTARFMAKHRIGDFIQHLVRSQRNRLAVCGCIIGSACASGDKREGGNAAQTDQGLTTGEICVNVSHGGKVWRAATFKSIAPREACALRGLHDRYRFFDRGARRYPADRGRGFHVAANGRGEAAFADGGAGADRDRQCVDLDDPRCRGNRPDRPDFRRRIAPPVSMPENKTGFPEEARNHDPTCKV